MARQPGQRDVRGPKQPAHWTSPPNSSPGSWQTQSECVTRSCRQAPTSQHWTRAMTSPSAPVSRSNVFDGPNTDFAEPSWGRGRRQVWWRRRRRPFERRGQSHDPAHWRFRYAQRLDEQRRGDAQAVANGLARGRRRVRSVSKRPTAWIAGLLMGATERWRGVVRSSCSPRVGDTALLEHFLTCRLTRRSPAPGPHASPRSGAKDRRSGLSLIQN